jgi:hypothetical protein
MHSIKNISERKKIDTQSRADAYIRRKRLISKSDYNFPLLGKYLKKTQKTPKKTKNPKNHWAGFFLNPGFFQPCLEPLLQGYPALRQLRRRFVVVVGSSAGLDAVRGTTVAPPKSNKNNNYWILSTVENEQPS